MLSLVKTKNGGPMKDVGGEEEATVMLINRVISSNTRFRMRDVARG